MKAKLFIPLILFIPLSAISQIKKIRTHINFDKGWKFHFGHATDANRDFNYGLANIFSKSGQTSGTCIGNNFNDSSWTNVQLPHDWAVGLPFRYLKNQDLDSHGYKPLGGLFPENSIGWYRKTFTVAASDSGKRFEIQFDGIYRDSKVWINGFFLGEHLSGYTGVTYDITDFIKFSKKNVITVRADATQFEGWFYEGAGIYRHAWLNSYSPVHFKTDGGVFAHAAVNGANADVTVETEIENKGFHEDKITIDTYLADRNGKVITMRKQHQLYLKVREEKPLVDHLWLSSPKLWSPDSPYLYRVISLIKIDGRLVDSVETKFGVRTFRFDSTTGFSLNGHPMKIKGVSCHQDHAGVGSALPDELQYYRIKLLKEIGVNAYRTTHNPPTPELLDACDSIGMLVMDETRLLTSGNEYEQQFRDLIIRDRNHPSVFLWSIGNEENLNQMTSIGKRVAQNQIELQQYLDPTRTSTYAANEGNIYQGVNEVIPIRGFNYHVKAWDDYHSAHPTQPIIGTEVGSTVTTRSILEKDTVKSYVPDFDEIFPSWATTAETWWKIAADRPWFMGGFVWTGFDYRGEPTPYSWPDINSNFGVMDMCGFPKNIYYYYQSWWTDKDVLHIAPHWNWKDKEGQPIDVWVNSNADNVELFLNGKSLGRQQMPRNGHLIWKVVYHPGTLIALAHRNGKIIKTTLETTGNPEQIVLTPSKKVLSANGEDAIIINVTVLDKENREVPNASNLINFSIAGDAEIIGVGNGDPSSHEADKCYSGEWHRALFGGKAQLIIRAGNSNSTIKVKGYSAGLKSMSLTLNQVLGKN